MSSVINVNQNQDKDLFLVNNSYDSKFKLNNLQKPQGKDALTKLSNNASDEANAWVNEIAADKEYNARALYMGVDDNVDTSNKEDQLAQISGKAVERRNELAIRVISTHRPQPDPEAKSDPAKEAFKSAATELKKAADKITSNFPPVFEQLAASADNNAVEVKNVNSFSANKDETTSIQIDQTAAAQKNAGAPLKADRLDFKTGSNTFKIDTQAGDSSKFNVNVNKNDTNSDVLQKAADNINKRDVGLNAGVARRGDRANLFIQSAGTGAKNAFNVSDINDKGFVARAGADNTVKKAADALYSVNGGGQKRSDSNDIYAGNGITATLKEKTDKPTNIFLSPDKDAIKQDITDFIDSFNELNKAADNFSEDTARQLRSSAGSLTDVGITYENGRLNADENRLDAAIEDGSLEEAFGAAGFVKKVGEIAANAQTDGNKTGIGQFIDVTL